MRREDKKYGQLLCRKIKFQKVVSGVRYLNSTCQAVFTSGNRFCQGKFIKHTKCFGAWSRIRSNY